MMQPVVIIATHLRYQITAANLRLLYPTTVVLVVTDINEAELYRSFDNVHVVMASNEPLGGKWNAGVQYAKEIPHTHLIVTGSDDILSKDFIERAVNSGKDFIGLRSWYVLNEEKLYLFDYLAPDGLPIGGGRCFSKRMLQFCDYKIFDPTLSKWLDNLSWDRATQFGNYQTLNEPFILAVKGNWQVMNPFEKHLKSKNTKLINTFEGDEAKNIVKEKFGYEY